MRMEALKTLALLAASAAWAGRCPDRQPHHLRSRQHYTALPTPQPTSTEPGKVEVAEIFMFGCPGCYMMEPRIQAWLAKKPDYVNFVRVPAPGIRPRSCMRARITRRRRSASCRPSRRRSSTRSTRTAITSRPRKSSPTFFAAHGVDATTFKTTFNSPEVAAKVKRAEELIGSYRVESTPTVVVNGKYVTQGRMAGTYEAWFAIIDDLAARENGATR